VFLLLLHPLPQHVENSRSLKPLSWLGDRSYSAYLWHWPVWLFLGHHVGQEILSIVLAFAITLALSALSYRFIERPFMARGRSSAAPQPEFHGAPAKSRPGPSNGVLVGLIVLPLIVGFGTLAVHDSLEREGILRASPPVPQADEDLDCIKTDCGDRDIDVLLVGDSHAGSIANALHSSLSDEGLEMSAAIVARHFGCLHLPSTAVTSINAECQDLSAQVRQLVTEKKPAIVIIHGYTAGRFTEINSGGDSEIKLINQQTGANITAANGVNGYRESLTDTADIIERSGAKMLVLSGVPDFTLRPEEVGRSGEAASQAELLLAPWFDFEFGQSVTRNEYLSRHGEFQKVERELAESNPNVSWVESGEFLCAAELCSQATPAGDFQYSDQDHVSDLGAEFVAEGLTEEMRERGLLNLVLDSR
jgi:hypothetical protein